MNPFKPIKLAYLRFRRFLLNSFLQHRLEEHLVFISEEEERRRVAVRKAQMTRQLSLLHVQRREKLLRELRLRLLALDQQIVDLTGGALPVTTNESDSPSPARVVDSPEPLDSPGPVPESVQAEPEPKPTRVRRSRARVRATPVPGLHVELHGAAYSLVESKPDQQH